MSDSSMRLEHTVQGGIMTISSRCDAIRPSGSRVSVVATLLRFLVLTARVIMKERAVFELSRLQPDAMINLDVTVLVRAIDEPPDVHWECVVRGAVM